jgi:hypothetical protein
VAATIFLVEEVFQRVLGEHTPPQRVTPAKPGDQRGNRDDDRQSGGKDQSSHGSGPAASVSARQPQSNTSQYRGSPGLPVAITTAQTNDFD